eukprot:5233172-Lingulodinium_polyedra.AAC.1
MGLDGRNRQRRGQGRRPSSRVRSRLGSTHSPGLGGTRATAWSCASPPTTGSFCCRSRAARSRRRPHRQHIASRSTP